MGGRGLIPNHAMIKRPAGGIGVYGDAQFPSTFRPLVENEDDLAETLVTCGPVVGRVTQNTAVILLEVDADAEVTCTLCPDDRENGPAFEKAVKFKGGVPGTFHFRSLLPGTRYLVAFKGLAKCYLEDLHCVVQTLPHEKQMKKVKFIAFSCDRFSRLEDTDENPWSRVLSLVNREDVTALLHLGDQVYMSQWGYLNRASKALLHHDDQPVSVKKKMHDRALQYLRDAYRDTWSFPEIRQVLAKSQHLMMWSDNDVANDFTVLKSDDGSQAYSDELLMCGMKVYREFQRQLWDPSCKGKLPRPGALLEEWQFHRFGACGVFLFDMRGNRITSDGVQVSTNPIMSEAQREAVANALSTPGISCFLMCAEIPFIGDEPSTIKKKAVQQPFLVDHWPYNDEELCWLLDAFFAWKTAERGRELLLIGGDIHVGAESYVFDNQTGSSIRQITTSPITNHVMPFYPDLEGRISDRYTFCHRPLPDQRNFCVIEVDFDSRGSVQYASANLVGVPTQAMLAKLQKHALKDRAPVLRSAGNVYATTTRAVDQESKGRLAVLVERVTGLPELDTAPRVQCAVRLGELQQETCPVKVEDGAATFDQRLEFGYSEEDFVRVSLLIAGEMEPISRADLSLAPMMKGWHDFQGCVPLSTAFRTSLGELKLSVFRF